MLACIILNAASVQLSTKCKASTFPQGPLLSGCLHISTLHNKIQDTQSMPAMINNQCHLCKRKSKALKANILTKPFEVSVLPQTKVYIKAIKHYLLRSILISSCFVLYKGTSCFQNKLQTIPCCLLALQCKLYAKSRSLGITFEINK